MFFFTLGIFMSERIAKRLLIVGWDAADWKIIDQLFNHQAMPNLRRMVDGGVRANLASLQPRLSPLLWTSIATGKTADKHGILNFVEPDPAGTGLRIASSTTRKTKALWNILTQSGMKVNVVGWYASHPAEPINGVCVSNLFWEGMPSSTGDPWPMLNAAVHPASMAEAIGDLRVHSDDIAVTQMVPLVPRIGEVGADDGRIRILARDLAQCASVHNVATSILDQDQNWDCTMVFYDTIDTIGHNFMQYHPPRLPHVSERDYELYQYVMYSVYQYHDLMLGTLLELAGPHTTVLLLSDHGFYSDHRRPVTSGMTVEQRAMIEALWHRPLGVLAMSGPGICAGQQIYGTTLLDIAPTALTLLGLPVGADMQGRVLLEAFQVQPKSDTVFSWDLIEGDAGMHPPDLRQDPFEARDAIRQLIALGYMSELPEESQAKQELAWRETQANLGVVYTSSGQSEKAIPIFEELVQRFPNERRFRFALLRALYVNSRLADCEVLIRDQIRATPDDSEAWSTLAVILAGLDRMEEANHAFDQAERFHQGQPDREATLGETCAALGRWADAERHFHKALAFDPDAAIVHYGLARAAIGQERFDEAVEHSLEALALVHVFPDAHHTLGVALTWLKDYPRAIKSFEVALSMRPGLLDSHRYLASIYRHLGDSENALKHRQISERLMQERSTGMTSIEFLKREAPMGPQEWVARLGANQRDTERG
jgi:predicted AlkP superfamily phosphohydrolase/phosphomutase/tetratricopeptide (TPR) repeat protein